MAGRFGTATGSLMKVATPTRTIIAPRERCASPHPPPSLSVSFFSIPIVLNTTMRQFTENPMRPKPTMSVETTMRLLPLGPGFAVPFFNDYSSSFVDVPLNWRPRTEIGNGPPRRPCVHQSRGTVTGCSPWAIGPPWPSFFGTRSEEHTSELQPPCNLVCRLLLDKKNHHQTDAHTRRPIPVCSPRSASRCSVEPPQYHHVSSQQYLVVAWPSCSADWSGLASPQQ